MDLKNKYGDETIKEMFADYRPTDAVPDWEHMSHIIQRAEADQVFDQEIRDSLSNIRLPYEQASWPHFQLRRQASVQRRNHIITARAVETLILVLLIWTSNRLILPSILDGKNSPAIENSIATEGHNDAITAHQKEMSSSQDNNALVNLSQVNNSTAKKIAVSPFKNKDLNTRSSANHSNSDLIKVISVLDEPQQVSVSEVQSTTPIVHEELNNTNVNATDKEQIEIIPVQGSSTTGQSEELMPIGIADLYAFSSDNSAAPLPALKITPNALSSGSTWISFNAGVLVNQVSSAPLTLVFNPESTLGKTQTQITPNCTGGLQVEFRHNRWSMVSGLQYIRYQYDPGLHEIYTNQQDQTIRKNFTEIKYQTLSIPILLQRNVLSNGRLHVHIRSGLSVTASLKNEYTISQELQKPNAGLASVIPPIETRSQFEQLDLQKGILQQGSFGQNAFVNFIAGTKVAYRVRNGLEYFAEANYSKMLGKFGFGPRGDSFQGVSIAIGTSIKL